MTVLPCDTVADLLAELVIRGIAGTVAVDGNLHLRPASAIPAGLLARLREHKTAVVRAIRLAALDPDQHDAWEERVAICMIDGGLSFDDAETIAWRQIGSPHVTSAVACSSQRDIEGSPRC